MGLRASQNLFLAIALGFALLARAPLHAENSLPPAPAAPALVAIKRLDPSEAARLSIRELLEHSAVFSEAIYAAMPEEKNPRRRLFGIYLKVMRTEMAALATTADWNGKLRRIKAIELVPGSSTWFARRTLQALSRIASAYNFAASLGIYLNVKSIIVEKDPPEIASSLQNLDVAMGNLRTALNRVWPRFRFVNHAVFVRGIKALAGDVDAHYAFVIRRADANEEARLHASIRNVLAQIERLAPSLPRGNLALWQELKGNPDYATVKRALRNVELPDSSDIDGADGALEKVLAVQIGFELVDHLLANAETWMVQQ